MYNHASRANITFEMTTMLINLLTNFRLVASTGCYHSSQSDRPSLNLGSLIQWPIEAPLSIHILSATLLLDHVDGAN